MAKDIIARLKADTSNFDRGFANAGKSLNQFKQKSMTMGGIVEQVTKSMVAYAAGVASVGTAMKVVKDIFMSSESNVDSWGRTMASAKSVYDSFCISLNNGSLDKWFENMDTLISKAKSAYNAMDDLNTVMTIINPERAKIQSQIDTQKEIIKKKGKDSAEGKAAQDAIKQLEPQLKSAYQRESSMNYNAFKSEVEKKLASQSITLNKEQMDWLMKSFDTTSAYDYMDQNAATTMVTKRKRWKGTDGKWHENTYQAPEANIYQQLKDLFTDEWRKQMSPYLTASYTAKSASSGVGIADARYTSPGKGGGKSGSGGGTVVGMAMQELDSLGGTMDDMTEKAWTTATSMEKLRDELSRLTKEADSTTNTEERNRLLAKASSLQNGIKNHDSQVRNAEGLAVMNPEALAKNIQDFMNENPIMIRVDVSESNLKATKMQDSWGAAADAISRVGSAMNGLNEPALNIATMLAETIATLGLTYAQTLAKDASSKSNIWTFIAAAAASTISLAATVASYKKSMNSYADGGVITGGAYAGDAVPIMANAGEVVLNAAMMSNLASNLQGGGGQQAQTYIKGEQLITVINNTRRRQGKGELL